MILKNGIIKERYQDSNVLLHKQTAVRASPLLVFRTIRIGWLIEKTTHMLLQGK